jgi:RNA polymerase sporulation-specific sigma factor
MNDITNLIQENERLIYKIISKYQNYFELEDLYQVAVMGLIKAAKNYQETYNTKFISYAYPYILGEVIKYVSEYRSIKLSKNTRLLYSKILKANQILSQKLMKTPSTYELAIFLEIDEKIINEVLLANSEVESLDKILIEDGRNFELYDTIGYYDQNIENYMLNDALKQLSSDEYKLINARYYQDLSQSETGSSLGMYQVEVSRKEKKILQRLKDHIA